MPSLTPSTEDRVIYEIAVIYPIIGQKEEQQAIKDVEAIFAEAGGQQIAKDVWGRRGLAYPIKNHREGNFIIYYYEFDPSKVREVDLALKIEKGVMRHLIIKPPKGYQILKYSELYEKWLTERETVDQVRAREKEEKLKDQVAKKAKQQARRTDDKKKLDATTKEKEKPMSEEALTEKLDKLISDDSIDL